MIFEHDDAEMNNVVNIKVIGVGGGGNNAVNRMISANIHGVEFVSVNTDRQALRKSAASQQLVIGEKITRGFGAGAKPEIGARAAEESVDDIRAILEGTDMVFITAGMGGGTGTGAAPVVARAAREMDILTVGIVTKPFAFEGKRRLEQAEAGIAELAQYVDSLIVIPNERLKQVSNAKISLSNAFTIADDVLRHGVQSISALIDRTGTVNLDFADLSNVMRNAGYAHMGVGSATGKDKAEQAAREAISSPLLETSIKGAKGILMMVYVSPDATLEDVELASTIISQEANPEANIIWGVTFDESMDDEMSITIVATGFEKKPEDEYRVVKKVDTNPESPYKKEAAPAQPAKRPTFASQPTPAQKPTQKPADDVDLFPMRKAAPAQKPKNTAKDNGFDDLFDMYGGRK